MYDEGISICITAYKADKFIKECLDSVMNQTWFKTHDNWEIIVDIFLISFMFLIFMVKCY